MREWLGREGMAATQVAGGVITRRVPSRTPPVRATRTSRSLPSAYLRALRRCVAFCSISLGPPRSPDSTIITPTASVPSAPRASFSSHPHPTARFARSSSLWLQLGPFPAVRRGDVHVRLLRFAAVPRNCFLVREPRFQPPVCPCLQRYHSHEHDARPLGHDRRSRNIDF